MTKLTTFSRHCIAWAACSGATYRAATGLIVFASVPSVERDICVFLFRQNQDFRECDGSETSCFFSVFDTCILNSSESTNPNPADSFVRRSTTNTSKKQPKPRNNHRRLKRTCCKRRCCCVVFFGDILEDLLLLRGMASIISRGWWVLLLSLFFRPVDSIAKREKTTESSSHDRLVSSFELFFAPFSP